MIEFSRATYDEIVHRADGTDREVCGVLAGKRGDDSSTVVTVYPADNAAATPERRYAIAPEEQFEILESIEADGLEVVGFYHSHPSGPTHPSETDADRATWPSYSYVIVALEGYPFVGSWRWRGPGERFDQELVRVVSGGDRSATGAETRTAVE